MPRLTKTRGTRLQELSVGCTISQNEKRPRDLASDDDVIKLLTLWGNKALDKSFYKSKNDDYYDYDDDMDDFIEDDLPKGPQCSCGVHLVKGALFCQSCGKKQPVCDTLCGN